MSPMAEEGDILLGAYLDFCSGKYLGNTGWNEIYQ